MEVLVLCYPRGLILAHLLELDRTLTQACSQRGFLNSAIIEVGYEYSFSR